MKKYIQIFLCLMMIVTTGCGKKKNNNVSKNTPATKKTVSKKPAKQTAFDENLAAFALEDDLHNFAHDQNKDSKDSNQQGQSKPNAMFQWQDATVDDSKDDFKIIYFEFDKYKITKEQEANLQADIDHAKKMIQLGKVIVIEGHACDSAGSAVYNMALSQRRAEFIATKFKNAGVDKANIKIAARGQEMPIHKGGNRHEQAVNRRVQVYAIDNK